MGNANNVTALLDMFQHPVFRVQNGCVADVNHAAAEREIKIGIPIADLLPHSEDAYLAYSGGCLSITIQVNSVNYIATVLRTEDGDIFHLQSMGGSEDLQSLTLSAQQLRNPLSEVMTAAQSLFETESLRNHEQVGLINRGLYRLLREIGNMSAISSYRSGREFWKKTANITAIINETVSKAQNLCSSTGRCLHYTAINDTVYCPTDKEMVERAIYNLISNAIKFSPTDSDVSITVSLGKEKLLLSVESYLEDPSLANGNLFMRYLRDASVEDGRHGIGLGIPLVQCAAATHNGTLLMDYPDKNKVRFTLTLSTISNATPTLRSPLPDFDYTGGWDQGLVELSDVLPPSLFTNS